MYFAANKKTAERYKEKLTRNRHIVEVDGKTYAYNAYGKQWYETQTGETYFDVGFERALEIIDKGEQKDVAINKLNNYLADIDEQATEMMFRLVEQMADKEGVTEQLKVENPMLWVGRMNEIQARAREIVYADIIYK